MRIFRSTRLPCPTSVAIAEVKTPRLLQHVAAPLVVFEPCVPASFPDEWSPQAYRVRLRLFGVIPFGTQVIDVSAWMEGNTFVIRDAGRSALIQRWDHVIRIWPEGDATMYSDDVTVKAGLLTPIIGAFAWIFYRHRQRRWRKLAAAGFHYETFAG